jgi:hypothetical protein
VRIVVSHWESGLGEWWIAVTVVQYCKHEVIRSNRDMRGGDVCYEDISTAPRVRAQYRIRNQESTSSMA